MYRIPRVLLLPAFVCVIQSVAAAQERGEPLNVREGAVLRMDDGSSRDLLPGATVQVVAIDGNRIRVRTWEHLLLAEEKAEAHHVYSVSYAYGSIPASMTMPPWLAVAHFSDLLAKAPDDSALLLARSFAYTCIREFDKAVADAKRAVTIHPKDPNCVLQLAGLENIMGHPLDAVRTCGKAIDACPSFTPAFLRRARAHSQLKQFDKAIVDCDTLLELQPDCVDALIERANSHGQQGDYQAEIADLTKALTHSPAAEQSMKAYCRRALARERSDDCEKALEDYTAALKQESLTLRRNGSLINGETPDRALILGNMAGPLTRMGRLDGAVNQATHALEIDARYIAAWYIRGLALGKQKKYDEAIASFDRAIEVAPKESRMYYCRAVMKDFGGKLDGAIDDFSRCIQLADDDIRRTEAYTGRAITWFKKGSFVEAESDLSRAIALQPNDAQLYSKRAVVWEKLGNAEKATADKERARELNGEK